MKLLLSPLIPFIILLLTQGCATTSQTLNITPYFDGQISYQGEALSEVNIFLSIKAADTRCSAKSKSATTGPQGEFSIRPVSKQQSYVPFVNYSYTEWTLCAVYKEQTYLLHQNDRYDDARTPSSIYLECDLARPAKTRCKSVY